MISAAEFEKKMNDVSGNDCLTKIAVGVSGGADSLCLTFLLQEWALKRKIKLYTFTVDHGLRAESAQEAKYVHQLMTSKGIWHKTLVWKGAKPTVAVEEKARQARYDLLLSACKQEGIFHLCLAHHQNDQAETFWLRLIRSSGVDGLSAMQPCTEREGVFLLRPLLDFSREDIQKTLKKRFAVDWIEDPSNSQPVYERVRLRQFQSDLDTLGLTAASVALSAKRLSRARSALEQITEQFIQKYVSKNAAGFAFVDGVAFEAQPQEIRLRVLDKMLSYVAGENYVARMAQLEKLLCQMPCRATLADCQIVSVKKGFYVCAEFAKMPPAKKIKPNKMTDWGRFKVVCDKKVTVAPLGNAWRFKSLPSLVCRTLPAFFDEKGLAFVPSLDYKRKNTDINGRIEIKE